MNAVGHLVSSAAVGAAVGTATGSPETGAALFVAGWAMDADHVIDFTRKWGLREALARMSRLGIGEVNRPDTVYLPLHAYEVPALLFALAAWRFPASPWLLGTAMGHLFHVLIDQATNVKRWSPTYFLTYRALHGFSSRALCPPGEGRAPFPIGAPPFPEAAHAPFAAADALPKTGLPGSTVVGRPRALRREGRRNHSRRL
ncbi:MAG: hypothetical protein ACE5IM_03605 [Nitrospinota bacterium]